MSKYIIILCLIFSFCVTCLAENKSIYPEFDLDVFIEMKNGLAFCHDEPMKCTRNCFVTYDHVVFDNAVCHFNSREYLYSSPFTQKTYYLDTQDQKIKIRELPDNNVVFTTSEVRFVARKTVWAYEDSTLYLAKLEGDGVVIYIGKDDNLTRKPLYKEYGAGAMRLRYIMPVKGSRNLVVSCMKDGCDENNTLLYVIDLEYNYVRAVRYSSYSASEQPSGKSMTINDNISFIGGHFFLTENGIWRFLQLNYNDIEAHLVNKFYHANDNIFYHYGGNVPGVKFCKLDGYNLSEIAIFGEDRLINMWGRDITNRIFMLKDYFLYFLDINSEKPVVSLLNRMVPAFDGLYIMSKERMGCVRLHPSRLAPLSINRLSIADDEKILYFDKGEVWHGRGSDVTVDSFVGFNTRKLVLPERNMNLFKAGNRILAYSTNATYQYDEGKNVFSKVEGLVVERESESRRALLVSDRNGRFILTFRDENLPVAVPDRIVGFNDQSFITLNEGRIFRYSLPDCKLISSFKLPEWFEDNTRITPAGEQIFCYGNDYNGFVGQDSPRRFTETAFHTPVVFSYKGDSVVGLGMDDEMHYYPTIGDQQMQVIDLP